MDERLAAAIDSQLDRAKKPFAIFDFDNTCIINDIGEATLAYLCGHELLRDTALLGEGKGGAAGYHERVFHTYHALLSEGKFKAAYVLCARMFSGFTPGEAEAAALVAITEEGSRIGSKVLYGLHIERGLAARPRALALMDGLRERGVHLWIMSASPEPAVRAAMRHFGIEAELIGVRSVIKDGVFTRELEQPMPLLEGKLECMRAFIDPVRSPLLVADDSPTGLPLLEMSAIKVVVGSQGELVDIAHRHGWFII